MVLKNAATLYFRYTRTNTQFPGVVSKVNLDGQQKSGTCPNLSVRLHCRYLQRRRSRSSTHTQIQTLKLIFPWLFS